MARARLCRSLLGVCQSRPMASTAEFSPQGAVMDVSAMTMRLGTRFLCRIQRKSCSRYFCAKPLYNKSCLDL